MKYLRQMAVIGTVTFLGEMMHILIPLPVPASIYGMVLLFLALCTGVLKEEQIEETAQWLLAVMPVMFVGPGVGIIEHYSSVSKSLLPFTFVVLVTTVLVMAVTGLTVQGVMALGKGQKKQGGDENA